MRFLCRFFIATDYTNGNGFVLTDRIRNGISKIKVKVNLNEF